MKKSWADYSDDEQELEVPLSSPVKKGIEKYIPIHRRPKPKPMVLPPKEPSDK